MNDVYFVAIHRDPSIVRFVEARENHPVFTRETISRGFCTEFIATRKAC